MSSLDDLASGGYKNVIDEVDQSVKKKAKRVVFCSGKVYYDLLEARQQAKIDHVALVRLEQLYPFPHHEIDQIFAIYTHVSGFVWCQEEPKNQRGLVL